MILPRHPSGDQDDDPTGVRALLSALPEPEPMPEDLVRRISASLAAEQAARGASEGPPEGPSEGVVVPLPSPRRHGRRVLAVAAVAAGIAAVGLAGSEVLHLGQGQSSAANSSASSAGANLAATSRPGDRAAGVSGLHIQQTSTRYTSSGFAAQAARLEPVQAVAPLTAEAPALGPIATPRGLRDCLGALGVPTSAAVTADIALYDGTPAVVLVTSDAGRRKAYAVQRTCSTGHPGLLHAATDLP